jgi:hypothetical protein
MQWNFQIRADSLLQIIKTRGKDGQSHTMLQLEINKTHHNKLIQLSIAGTETTAY